jgi:hypothetical protein
MQQHISQIHQVSREDDNFPDEDQHIPLSENLDFAQKNRNSSRDSQLGITLFL